MRQSSIWMLGALLLAAAGVVAIAANGSTGAGLALLAIAALFVIVGATQRGDRSKPN